MVISFNEGKLQTDLKPTREVENHEGSVTSTFHRQLNHIAQINIVTGCSEISRNYSFQISHFQFSIKSSFPSSSYKVARVSSQVPT